MQPFPTIGEEYADYLRDESRMAGTADTISFPKTEADLSQTLARLFEGQVPVTFQGARTGVAGGAVPRGGHVVNFSRMNRILGLRRDEARGHFLARVEPGLVLSGFRKAILEGVFDAADWSSESKRAAEDFRRSGIWFFPPDPTETSAAAGGMVACNASGACSFRYGPTRHFVESLRLVLSDGATLSLRRGREKAAGRHYSLRCENGRALSGQLPSYRMPAVKNASGYYAEDDMDMVDLLVGSEGTLAAVLEAEFRLIPAPGAVWAVMSFFPTEAGALHFVREVRALAPRPAAIEYFDAGALSLLREQKRLHSAFAALPDTPEGQWSSVYVEYHGANDDEVSEGIERMTAAMVACGGNEDLAWMATAPAELERLKTFRHAVPEAVNLQIDARRKTAPGITKLGTDMAVPDRSLEEVMALYRAGLQAERLDHAIFGHAGNNHLHVNILPRNADDYARGRRLYLEWAKAVVGMGGTISAEHGVGKLKVALLAEMYGPAGIEEMRTVKRVWDPSSLLNPGTLFAPAP